MKYDVLDPGTRLVGTNQNIVSDIKACQDQCDEALDCHSIRFCPNSGKCALMDKVITGIEKMVDKSACHTSYQTVCDGVGKTRYIIGHVALNVKL